jgi:hypothetical protein
MGILEALGARASGGLQFGEAADDPTARTMSKYLASSGGNQALAAQAAWNDRERARKRTNMAGGSTLLQIENESRFGGGDPKALQVAMKLRNLANSGGKTQGTFGEAPRPELTGQARGQFAQLGQQAIARRNAAVDQQQRQAESDAARLGEQRRLQIEGDAWERQQAAVAQAQRATGPAMTALATRPLR